MILPWLIPIILQGAAIFLDELAFHPKRMLPLWERIGHPLDSFCFLICLTIPIFMPFRHQPFLGYLVIAGLSCLMITKDEWVHARHCSANEHWLHSVLFILHPIILLETLVLWSHQSLNVLPSPAQIRLIFIFQCMGTLLFLIFQIFNGIMYGFKHPHPNPSNQ